MKDYDANRQNFAPCMTAASRPVADCVPRTRLPDGNTTPGDSSLRWPRYAGRTTVN